MTNRKQTEPETDAPTHRGIRPALRAAIDDIAINGTSIKQAALKAGMSTSTLSLALRKPHVKAAMEAMQADSLTDLAKLTAQAKVVATRQAIHLINNAQSEVIRAKMVELFVQREAGSPARKAASPPAFEPASPSNGYTYTKPSAPPDRPSGAQDRQAIDKPEPEPDG